MILAAGCADLGSGNAQNIESLNGDEYEEGRSDEPRDPGDPGDPGDPAPEEPTDPWSEKCEHDPGACRGEDPGAPMCDPSDPRCVPPEEHPCDDPPPPDRGICESIGAICVPYDLEGTGRECPEGLIPQPLPCEADPWTGEPLFCCGFGEDPGRPGEEPPPDPDVCARFGGFCAPVAEDRTASCPEGFQPIYELPCLIDWETGTQSVCCGFGDPWGGEEPPPPPRDPEPNVCPDPSDPNVFYVSQDIAVCHSISYSCPSNHVVFDSACGCGCIRYQN